MTEIESLNGGKSFLRRTSDSPQESSSMSSTSTDLRQCLLCKTFWGMITTTMDQWSALVRASISTSYLSGAEIAQGYSAVASTIEALADTWSHHLLFIHQVGYTDGKTVGIRGERYQWYLKTLPSSSWSSLDLSRQLGFGLED